MNENGTWARPSVPVGCTRCAKDHQLPGAAGLVEVCNCCEAPICRPETSSRRSGSHIEKGQLRKAAATGETAKGPDEGKGRGVAGGPSCGCILFQRYPQNQGTVLWMTSS